MTSNGERVLAVILGRAGSKGLPGKNALPLAGRPMICHTIEDALNATCIDDVVVSTDGKSIADAAASMGVAILHRPPSLADDHATVDAATRHAVEDTGSDALIIVILYANVPIRPDGLIDRAIETLIVTGADSVQSYCRVGKHHPWWMVGLDEAGRVVPHVPNRTYRRQDLPPLFIPDGGVIAVRRASLFAGREDDPQAFFGTDRCGIETKPGDVVDVDDERDLRVAETMLAAEAIPC